MIVKSLAIGVILVLTVSVGLSGAIPPPRQVHLELFYEPGCPECAAFDREVEPQLRNRFGDNYRLTRYDIGEMTNYLRLVAYQKAQGQPFILNFANDVKRSMRGKETGAALPILPR